MTAMRFTVTLCAALAVADCAPSTSAARPSVVIDLLPALGTAAPRSTTAVPSPPPAPARARSLLGVWEGTGTQSNGDSWPMVVQITSLAIGECATVRYPSLSCSGEWLCTETSDGAALRGQEHILEGRSICLDGNVVMSLTVNDDLSWHWEGDDHGRAMTAEATLHRAASGG